jgi:hypothetical protein
MIAPLPRSSTRTIAADVNIIDATTLIRKKLAISLSQQRRSRRIVLCRRCSRGCRSENWSGDAEGHGDTQEDQRQRFAHPHPRSTR